MPDRSAKSIDRRDLIMASVATIGVAAAVAASAANAQGAATPNSASGTVYTGDLIEGKKVVNALDVNDLEPGKKHLLYFQGVEMPSGQHWYVSVTVAKGAMPGKRGVLTSGVHGDEMSSVHTVQTVMAQLDPAQMSGAVMAVTDVSRPALESMQRRWPNQGRGILHAGNRCCARPGPRDDLALRGRHNERPQTSRHRHRANGTYRQGRDCLCR